MKRLAVFLCVIGFVSGSRAADITNSAWVGESELSLDGTLRCSADPNKNPTYRPVGNGYHSFVIREGGLGWVWPSVTGGCAHSLGSGLQLQQKGNDLFDSKNRKVGAITDQKLLAQNFETSPDEIVIEKLEFSLVSPYESKLEVKFRSPHYRGLFTYSANYRRYR